MGLPAVVETAGFTPLVNGDSLANWDGDKQLWSAKDGVLIGRSQRPGPQRVPRHHPALWQLRALAQLPAGRRPGE